MHQQHPEVLTGRNMMSIVAVSSIVGPLGVVLKCFLSPSVQSLQLFTTNSKIVFIGLHRHCSYDIPKKIE